MPDQGVEREQAEADESGITLAELVNALVTNWKLLLAGPLVVGVLSLGITFLIAPTFTAKTTFLPPQQSQSSAAAALASLGPLAGLAGGVAGVRNSGDQYVALLQSASVSDRIIEDYKLVEAYNAKLRVDARTELANNVRIALGKKDGIISVEVDDTSPQRAADIANRYVDELRRVTGVLAVTEAQQRRVFFEQQLKTSRDRLAQAQDSLQASGFNAGAIKAEPKAAAEAYAKLKAEATAVEVRLQVLRGSMTDSAPEVRQQLSALTALRAQLSKTEQPTENTGAPDYVGRYREYKYQEALFEIYARQFEIARVDESREGQLIQVIDAATAPERKSKPRRGIIAVIATLVTGSLLMAYVLIRRSAFK